MPDRVKKFYSPAEHGPETAFTVFSRYIVSSFGSFDVVLADLN
jgi:hypothetical protein